MCHDPMGVIGGKGGRLNCNGVEAAEITRILRGAFLKYNTALGVIIIRSHVSILTLTRDTIS